MKKVALCLLVLAMPSRDGAYYCAEKFSGGVAYDSTLNRWGRAGRRARARGTTAGSGRRQTLSVRDRDGDRFGKSQNFCEGILSSSAAMNFGLRHGIHKAIRYTAVTARRGRRGYNCRVFLVSLQIANCEIWIWATV